MDIEDFFDIIYQLEKVEGVDRYCAYFDYGPLKRDKIINTDQYVVFRSSCCGYRYRMIKKSGSVVIKNSYKASPKFRELTCTNGWSHSSLEITNNKIIHRQNGKREIVYTKELHRTHLITTRTVNNAVTLTKYYRAIGENIQGMH